MLGSPREDGSSLPVWGSKRTVSSLIPEVQSEQNQ